MSGGTQTFASYYSSAGSHMLRLTCAAFIFIASSLCIWILIRQHPIHFTELRTRESIDNEKIRTKDIHNSKLEGPPKIYDDYNPNYDKRKQSETIYPVDEDTNDKRKEERKWAFPSTLEELSGTAHELQTCKREHFTYMASLLVGLYLYKQAFAIPGSFLLNIAAGALFGVWSGFLLCCCLTTCGSAISYCLSNVFGKAFLLQRFGTQIGQFQARLNANSRRQFLFLIFARLFPASPSWLVNIAAPVLDVPFGLFLVTTFIGLSPYIFIGVHAGSLLSELDSWQDIFSLSVIAQLTIVSLVPLWLAYYVANPNSLTNNSLIINNVNEKILTPNVSKMNLNDAVIEKQPVKCDSSVELTERQATVYEY